VTVSLVAAIPALGAQGAQALAQDLAIAAVGRSEALELELLPALAQVVRRRRIRLVAAGQVVEERGQAALPVDERPVAVESGDVDLLLCDPSALLH
jgi:hypothetical protein